jgi:hypothetical protein
MDGAGCGIEGRGFDVCESREDDYFVGLKVIRNKAELFERQSYSGWACVVRSGAKEKAIDAFEDLERGVGFTTASLTEGEFRRAR